MKNIEFSLILKMTSSKILGYLILIIGTVVSFILKDSAVFISSAVLSAGLHGLRSWSEGMTLRRDMEHRQNCNDYNERFQGPNEDIG